MPRKKNTKINIFEQFDHHDRERFSTWDKRDWTKVSIVYQRLRNYNKFLDELNEIMLMARKADEKPYLYRRFKISKDEKAHITNLQAQYKNKFFTLLYWWENNLERKFADQTCYWFDTKEKFEPLECQIISNKLTGRGLRLCAEYMTGQSAAYPKWIGLGEGVSTVRADDQELDDEVARESVDYYNGNGNIISSGKLFPPTVPDALITEVGGFTGPTNTAALVWRSVITEEGKWVDHIQGDDRPAASHSLYLTSR